MLNSLLLVDDEQVLIRAIADFLDRHRYVTSIATTGEEALEVIENEPPDVVLLDYRLPERTGCKYFKRLKRNIRRSR